MDAFAKIPGLSALGGGGGLPGLSALGLPGGAAAARSLGDLPGMPPMSMDPLLGMVQQQEQITIQLLKMILELIAGRQQQGGGASGGGAASGAPAASGAAGASGGSPYTGGVPAEAGKWVEGDVQGLNPDLLQKLAQVGQRMGQKISISSGFRSRQEQEVLYQKYLNGTGNLAAKPGTSNHESGNAADVKIGGQSLGDNAQARQIALELGLHFPVPGEPWHVEVK